MTGAEHLSLAQRVWSKRLAHRDGTCECTPRASLGAAQIVCSFSFLAELTPAQFAVYYVAGRRLPVTAEEIARSLT